MVGPSAELLRFALAAALIAPAVVVLPATLPLVVAVYAALALSVVWDFVRLRRLPPLAGERRLPHRALVGQPAVVELNITNPGSRPAKVVVVDEVPAALRRDDPVFDGVEIAGNANASIFYEIEASVRGDHRLGALQILRRSPLGLLERRESFGSDVVRALPDVARLLRAHVFAPRHRFGRSGVQPARRRGQGSELDSLRDYVPGDDPRRISWGASARRGHPVVRLDRHERSHVIWVAVDTSRLMGAVIGRQTKLDQALDAALVLAAGALTCEDRVGIVAFDSDVHTVVGPHRRRSELAGLVDALQPLAARAVEPDYRILTRRLLSRIGQRALVVVLTDFTETNDEVVVAAMKPLARRHRVVLAGLRDPEFAQLDVRRPEADDPLAAYRRIVLGDLLEEREALVGRLRRAGVDVLDIAGDRLNARLLDRYLEVRYGPER